MPFLVNNTPIKNPSNFRIERYNVSNMERLANADMVGDLIAKKVKFYFTYEAIDSLALNNILGAIWDVDYLFYPFTYEENGVTKTVTVYSGSIPTELHRASPSSLWVWRNVTFNLIQR